MAKANKDKMFIEFFRQDQAIDVGLKIGQVWELNIADILVPAMLISPAVVDDDHRGYSRCIDISKADGWICVCLENGKEYFVRKWMWKDLREQCYHERYEDTLPTIGRFLG